MSRVSSHRANAPNSRQPSRFKGFRKEWHKDPVVIKSYGDKKRQRRKEAWEKYEAERAKQRANNEGVLLQPDKMVEETNPVGASLVNTPDVMGVSQSG